MRRPMLKLTVPLMLLAAVPVSYGQLPPVRGASAGSGDSAAGSSAVPVTNEKRTVNVYDALVTLIDDVKVPATEMGMLTAIHVVEGQQIEDATVLADVDNRESIAKQLIAQGELDAALAQAESDAELEVAKKAVDVAREELTQQEDIRKVNPTAVSLTELRKYRFQLQRAEAQVRLAETDRNIAALTAETKRAQLQAIDIEFDRRKVKAPFSGEVVEIFRKRGEWVQAGEPVMHIAHLDKCRVKGFVQASHASPHELEGKPVEIEFQASNGKPLHIKATIGYASEVIEGVGSSRQFRIWADIDNQKLTDPVTKKEYWAIQPGSMAQMTIDLTPPAPPKASPARPKLTPVKNEVRKPVAEEGPRER